MTKDEFTAQSDELFQRIKSSFVDKVMSETTLAFEKARSSSDPERALSQLQLEITQIMATKSFEASCDYSEKLAFLLFENFSK